MDINKALPFNRFKNKTIYLLCRIIDYTYILSKIKSKKLTLVIFKSSFAKLVDEKILVGHIGPVCCLIKLNDTQVISGSWDKSIKQWDLTNGNCLKTLNGHTNIVWCLIKL